MAGGLRVGPAIGFVGALVHASVTTKLWPSHPLVDSRSGIVSGCQRKIKKENSRTVRPPGFVLVLDDDLPQSCGHAVGVVVYHRLSDLQSRLPHEIFEFLPSAMGWNLSLSDLRV